MKYGVVCTNFNNTHFTAKLIESLSLNKFKPASVVVVDNNSIKESVVALEQLSAVYPILETVLNSQNVGYFRGLNDGIHRLLSMNSDLDFVVIGNNDLEFPVDFGSRLDDYQYEWSSLPVISPAIITLDGVHQNPHVIDRISVFRQFIWDLYYTNYWLSRLISAVATRTREFSDRKDEMQHDTARFIHQGYGACYILTRSFFENFDELWAPGMMFGEEYFLSRQLAGRGFRTYYDPRISVTHHCNGSVASVASRTRWELARDAHRIYRRFVTPWGLAKAPK
jgi:GT2 family glycosyltransferase